MPELVKSPFISPPEEFSAGMRELYSTPRRQVRLDLKLPVRVRGRDSQDCEWAELTHFINVNQMGARIILSRPTEPGRILQLTSALPSQLRGFDFAEAQYRVWAVVVNTAFVQAQGPEPLQIEAGVAFIGPRPPQEFEADPSKLYEIVAAPVGAEPWRVRELPYSGAKGEASRPETRHPIAVEIELQSFAKQGAETVSELTVTENLSCKGAAVFTTLDLQEGRYVRVVSAHPTVSLLAAVRLRRSGGDGHTRLHLEFINGEWPFEGVESPP